MAKDTIRIDFSKEEESGGQGRINWPEGDYHVQILKAKAVRSSEKDTPGIRVTFKVIAGKKKGKTFSEDLWLTPKSLVRIRLLLEAVGVKVPKSAVNLPLKKLKGKTLWIELNTEERDGYDDRSRIAFQGFMSEEDYDPEDGDDDEDDDDLDDEVDDDDEEEDEKPKKKSKKSAAKKGTKKKSGAKKGKAKKSKKSKDDEDIDEIDLDEL